RVTKKTITATLVPPSLACAPPPNGLINWWRGEGNATDEATMDSGTLLNGTSFAAGRVGQAFSFDGLDDVLMIGYGPIPTPWTAEFWVNRLDSPNDSAI